MLLSEGSRYVGSLLTFVSFRSRRRVVVLSNGSRKMSEVDVRSVFDTGENRHQCAQCTCFFRGRYVRAKMDSYWVSLCSNQCIQEWYAPERSRNWENAPTPLPTLPS